MHTKATPEAIQAKGAVNGTCGLARLGRAQGGRNAQA